MVAPKSAFAMLKPWPSDCVLVVAPLHGERREHTAVGHPVLRICKDCGHLLEADSFTVERAETMPERHGRPVRFVCVPCHYRYDRSYIQKVIDHSGFTGQVVW